jgi:pyrimidine operon attenuation protein/uracil phosphoribosyltransferase
MSEQKKYILTEEQATRKLQRMAYEIVEENLDDNTDHIILAGIKEHGLVIAKTLQQMLSKIFKGTIEVVEVELDKRNPREIKWSNNQDYTGKAIILTDDVANSGKTMLYALKPLLNFHPRKIQTLALIERLHKKFPVHTDYVGLSISTTLQEHIFVEVEGDRITGAYLV